MIDCCFKFTAFRVTGKRIPLFSLIRLETVTMQFYIIVRDFVCTSSNTNVMTPLRAVSVRGIRSRSVIVGFILYIQDLGYFLSNTVHFFIV